MQEVIENPIHNFHKRLGGVGLTSKQVLAFNDAYGTPESGSAVQARRALHTKDLAEDAGWDRDYKRAERLLRLAEEYADDAKKFAGF